MMYIYRSRDRWWDPLNPLLMFPLLSLMCKDPKIIDTNPPTSNTSLIIVTLYLIAASEARILSPIPQRIRGIACKLDYDNKVTILIDCHNIQENLLTSN